MRIAVDAMGGDHAPGAIIEGALLALERHPDMEIVLLGRREAMLETLAGRENPRITLEDCPSVIETGQDSFPAISDQKGFFHGPRAADAEGASGRRFYHRRQHWSGYERRAVQCRAH